MITTNALGHLWGAAIVLLSTPFAATAQLSTGSVTDVAKVTCQGVFPLNARTTCYTATVICPDEDDTSITFGVTTPAKPKGTIVLHDGDTGTSPYEEPGISNGFARAYFQAGFQVVELAWGGTGWEGLPPGSIKTAACRPATFFQYIYDNFYSSAESPVYNPTDNPTAGFCLQGHSAGAGAIAYYLTHYNGAAYVDKALLSSGPHFAEIDQGCEVPAPPSPVTICPNGGGTPNSWPCSAGVDPPGSWTEYPTYTYGQMGGWTASPCSDGEPTTQAQDTAWSIMSIVDLQQTPTDANYVMPQTAVSAYLCHYIGSLVNPSEAQGWLYYNQFQEASIANLIVNEVNDCQNQGVSSPEYVFYATKVNGATGKPLPHFTWAPTVMFDDMTDAVTGCVRRH